MKKYSVYKWSDVESFSVPRDEATETEAMLDLFNESATYWDGDLLGQFNSREEALAAFETEKKYCGLRIVDCSVKTTSESVYLAVDWLYVDEEEYDDDGEFDYGHRIAEYIAPYIP